MSVDALRHRSVPRDQGRVCCTEFWVNLPGALTLGGADLHHTFDFPDPFDPDRTIARKRSDATRFSAWNTGGLLR